MGVVHNLATEDKLLEETESDLDFVRNLLSLKKFGPIPRTWHALEYFSEVDHAAELRALAKGLTIREILDFYCIGQFSDLPRVDQHFFCTMFLKGRSTGTYDAVNHLFSQMQGVQGVKASLEYLRRHSGGWSSELSDDSSLPKSVRIVIDE